MDVATAVTRIKRQFGDEYDVVVDDDDIYGYIHEAEIDIIRNTGCNDNTISVASNVVSVNTPTTVNIKRVSIDGKALQYITADELDLVSADLDTTGSYPRYWYRSSIQTFFYPVGTNADKTVNILYNKTPNLMSGTPASNTFTIPEVYHDDLIKYCIARAHNKNNNLQAEQMQMQMYDKNLNLRSHEAQVGDTALYKAGDPDDFYAYGELYS